MNVFQLKITCPDLQAQIDVQQLREVLSSSPGYSAADFDIPTHTIIVSTANQDGGQNLIREISRAGYPPADVELIQQNEMLDRVGNPPA